MPIVRILIDGHEFHGKGTPNATPEAVKKDAEQFAIQLETTTKLTVDLVGESILVLGKAQIDRAVFVFVP